MPTSVLRTKLMDLSAQGELSPEDVKRVKAEHEAAYQRAYQAEYRKRKKRVSAALDPAEHDRLVEESKRHDMSPTAFLRAAAFAYMDGVYLTPDADTARELELALRRIGNNCNQVAKRVNVNRSAKANDIMAMNALLTELEETIAAAFKEPYELLTELTSALEDRPALAVQVQAVLDRARAKAVVEQSAGEGKEA